MSKEIHDPNITLTFSHSLPFAHVLSYLRTAATFRRAALTDLEMAAHYTPDADTQTRLEKRAEEELHRADGYLDIVRVMQPQPMAKELVADYLSSVMNPRRSGEDLKMVADIVAEQGLDRLEQMAKYGFQRSDDLLLGRQKLGVYKKLETQDWLNRTEVVDYTDLLDVEASAARTNETMIKSAQVSTTIKDAMSALCASPPPYVAGDVEGLVVVDQSPHITLRTPAKNADEEVERIERCKKIAEAIKAMMDTSKVSFQVDERSRIDEVDKLVADRYQRSLREMLMRHIEGLTTEERLGLFRAKHFSLPLEYRARIDGMYYNGHTTQANGAVDKQQLDTMVRMCFVDFDNKSNTYTINSHALDALKHIHKPTHYSMSNYLQFTFRADRAVSPQNEPNVATTTTTAPNEKQKGEGERRGEGGEKNTP